MHSNCYVYYLSAWMYTHSQTVHETHRQQLSNRTAWMQAHSALSVLFSFLKEKMSSLKQICINILSHVVNYLGVKYLLSLNWIVLKLNWLSINEIFNTKLFSLFYRKNIRKRLIFPVQQRLRFIRLSGKFSKTYVYRMIEKIEIYPHNFTIVYSYNLVTSCSEVVLFLAT